MAVKLYIRRQLLRKKFSKQVFINILVLTLTVSIILGSVSPNYSQTSTPTTRKALIEKIKGHAESHVKNDNAMQTALVIKLYENNSVGLTAPEIATIYEEEYTKLKEEKEKNLWEKLPEGSGWITAGILLILVIFRDALQEWFSNAVKRIGNWFYNRLAGNPLLLGIALRRYQKALIKKHQKLNIPFRSHRPLDMGEVYVPLKVAGTLDSNLIEAYQAIAQHCRLMVKGLPGSGKTMLMKHIALSYAQERWLVLPDRSVPILIELHRLSDPELNQEKLQQQLLEALERDDFPKANRFLSQSLNNGSVMLLFDGLDEVNSSVRPRVVQQIKDLLDKYDKCRVIITCRSAVYNNEFAEVVNQTLEVVEFSDRQIRHFLRAWKAQMPPDKSIEQLMQTLRDRPKIMSLARNPLLLTIIAYLYTDTPFVLPHSRAEFYQKSTDILLDQWRGDFNQYRASDKRRVLQHLAFYIQDNASLQQRDRRTIDYTTVLQQIQQVLPSLNLQPDTDTKPILDEISDRSGLLLRIDGGERYQFAHLTLQEYFAAAALIDKSNDLVNRFKADPDTWRETVKLWCGIAGNSTTLIQAVYAEDAITGFECLADAQEVKQALADSIIDRFKNQLDSTGEEESLISAFGAVAADFRPRGKAVFQFLEETLAHDQEQIRQQAAANALSMTNLPQAAGVLASHYLTQASIVRKPLVRMGDLAVLRLASLAQQESLTVLDDLLTIGTPDAATALVPCLWHSSSALASYCAWCLAVLLPQQEIEETLRNYQLTEEQRKAECLDWIWQPFGEPQNSALPIIAGRMAYLISHTSINPGFIPVSKVDPRLIIPLCSIQSIHQVELPKQWSSQADALLEQQEQNPQLARQFIEQVNQIIEQVNQILGAKNSHSRWGLLLSSLPVRLQLDLLHRLINYRRPTRNDWRNLFWDVKYEFKRSWHYRLVLIVASVISFVAMLGMIVIISRQPENWMNGLIGLASIVIYAFWVFLWRGIEKEERLEPNTFIQFGLLGIFTFWSELRRLLYENLVWAGADSLLVTVFGVGAGALAGAGAWVVAVARAGAGAVARAGAGVVTVALTGAVARAVAGAGAWDWAGAWVVAGAASRTVAEAGALAVAVAVVVAGAGLGAWVRAKSKRDLSRFLAIFAFPWFCWFPIVVCFATLFLLHFFSWQSVLLIWLVLIGTCTVLWLRGQKLEQQARNPLRGILKKTT